MPKIYCADTSCEFCSDKGVCTAKKVSLSWHSVMTLWDGRQEFNRCKTYQKSKLSTELEQRFKEISQKMKGESANEQMR